jgi:hypothetical protein
MSVATVPATATVTVTQTGKKVIAPVPVRPKKVIPPIKRPGLYEFGIAFDPDYVWKDGVYIFQHGRKQLYFSCELPVCQNGDVIEVNSLYMTVIGIVTVRAMYPDGSLTQNYEYKVINGDGEEETLLTWEFESTFF